MHRIRCGRTAARLKSPQTAQLSGDALFWEDTVGGEVSSVMESETFRPTARAKTLMLSSVTFCPFSTRLTKLWPRLACSATCSCVQPRAARFRSRAAPNCWQRRLDIRRACSCTDGVRFLGALEAHPVLILWTIRAYHIGLSVSKRMCVHASDWTIERKRHCAWRGRGARQPAAASVFLVRRGAGERSSRERFQERGGLCDGLEGCGALAKISGSPAVLFFPPDHAAP